MFITYCRTCNRIFYSNKLSHYCKKCRTLLTDVPFDLKTVSDMSINERYRLAYRLTNDYPELLKETDAKTEN